VSFFTLPPEINSLRMFMGAGSAPMLQASAAWNGLAAELGTAAQSFGSVISNLAGQAWQGAASAAMAAAAAPYAGWLAAAAAQSQSAAGQAMAVVSAFEAAQAATVHPGAVDSNRNAFVNLVMSNLFGQNAPLIALAESIYEEMWAADVTAMAGYYANAAAAASQVVPWQNVLQSFPALAGGIAGGLSGAAGSNSAAAGSGSAAAGGGQSSAGNAGAGAAAGGGGAGAGGVGSADGGAAPASYTGGDAGSYTSGDTAGAAAASGAPITTANTGVSTGGVGGFGMMPMPMPMGGVARAGLLGDSPSIPVPTKSEKDEEVTHEAESTEAAEAVQSSETPEAEVPTMTVLPTAAPDIAARAAPGEARPAAQPAASGIPVSGLRAAASSQVKDGSEASDEPAEAEEAVATLRPQIAPGEFHPRAVEEEAPKVQIRGA
jgi:PPE family